MIVAQALPAELPASSCCLITIKVNIFPEPIPASYMSFNAVVTEIFRQIGDCDAILHLEADVERSLYSLKHAARKSPYIKQGDNGLIGSTAIQPSHWRLCPSELTTDAWVQEIRRDLQERVDVSCTSIIPQIDTLAAKKSLQSETNPELTRSRITTAQFPSIL